MVVSTGLSLISSAAPIPPNLKASSTASSLTIVTTSSPVITPINFCSLSITPAETKLYCVKIFPTFSLSRSAGMKVLFSATKSLTFIFGFDLKIFEIDALPTG